MEPWIVRMCREVSRRRFIAWTVTLLAGVAFVVYCHRYVANFLQGPYSLSAEELAQITDAQSAPRYFVSVDGEKMADTGIQEVTTTTNNGREEGSYVSAHYYAMVVGDHYLIVKSAKEPPLKVEGELARFSSDLSNQLFTGDDGRALQAQCYPFYLQTEGFRSAGYWGIAIGLVLLLLIAVFAPRAWIQLQNIDTHPVLRRVRKWGDPTGISMEVEREFNSMVRYKSTGLFLTDRYAIRKSFFSFNVLRFEDLLWAYKKITKRSVNFIPTGKSYEAILHFYGGNQTFSGSENLVGEVLGFAASKAPWAVVGYSKEVENLFQKQTSVFCAAVEERRKGVMSKSS